MSQWLCQGMMNSRLFSVRVIRPARALMRFRGTTRWMPFEARTRNCPRPPSISWISSIHTPVALIVWRARISNSRPDSRSRTRAPVTRSSSRTKPTTRVLLATAAP